MANRTETIELCPDVKTVKDALAREIVSKYMREKWEDLKSRNLITETDQGKSKIYTFQPNASITLKEVFSLLQYFLLLFPKDKNIIYRIIEFPGDGKTFKLKFEWRRRDLLKHVYKDPNDPDNYLETNLTEEIGNVVDQLRSERPTESSSYPKLPEPLKKALEITLPYIYSAKLNSDPVFEAELIKQDKRREVTDEMKEEAFREAIEVMASISILATDLTALNPPSWIQNVYESYLKTGREELDAKLEEKIKNSRETKLMFELTASMLKTSEEVKESWKVLQNKDTYPGSEQKIIEQRMSEVNPDKVEEVIIRQTDFLELVKVFKMLQSFNDLFPNNRESERIRFIIPIGGQDRTIYLSRAPRGENQILVETRNRNWPDATEQIVDDYYAPSYDIMVNKVLKNFPNHQNLAKAVLTALDSKLDAQPNFQEDLKVTKLNADDSLRVVETADTIRNIVELMVITMVAEAAQPSDQVKTKFIKHIAKTIQRQDKNRFPTKNEMPELHKILNEKVLLSGRSPVMDQLARKIFLEISRTGIQIHEAFTDAKYPARQATRYDEEGKKRLNRAKGGAQLAREYLYLEGDQLIPSYLISQLADTDYDRETVVKRAIQHCMSSKTSMKRAACSLEELNDKIIVNEKYMYTHIDKLYFYSDCK